VGFDDGDCFVMAVLLGFFEQAGYSSPDPAVGLGVLIAETLDPTGGEGGFAAVGDEGGEFGLFG